ncbi:putative leucine-rich repeat domain superfamily [Helianthus annuus]|nr:putative leucine-rich repeat domain superfamily [Helianthus annuus]
MFDKDDLILLWMAEGFLNQSSSNKLMERLGLEYFEELLSRSFFQHAPNEKSVFVDVKKEALEEYRHMSFVNEEYVAYLKFKPFKCAKKLRTFLTVSVGLNDGWRGCYLSSMIPVELVPKLQLLRVLCLSGYFISEVPKTIGNLRHLRYLNLSRTKITHLPENVSNIYNLQTLIVFGCEC